MVEKAIPKDMKNLLKFMIMQLRNVIVSNDSLTVPKRKMSDDLSKTNFIEKLRDQIGRVNPLQKTVFRNIYVYLDYNHYII